MNLWEKVTGSDMTKEMKTFESRAKKLPADYQAAWGEIFINLMPYSDFSGRNLMPILDGVLSLLEEAAADGQSAQEVLGVDFEVEKGSIFALTGSNGAGKTTIVKILSTLQGLDSGTATVNGFDVTAKPNNVRESISLTGQFAAVNEILTGRENLIMIAKLRHLKNTSSR